MSDANAAPPTGFVLERVTTVRQRCEAVDPATSTLDTAERVDLGWDWRWTDDQTFEVALTLQVLETSARPESVAVSVVGRFLVVGRPDKVAPAQFAYGHAPAILFPFVRQVVSTLTTMSPFGVLLLPPLNVAEIMKSFDPQRAAAAAQKRPA